MVCRLDGSSHAPIRPGMRIQALAVFGGLVSWWGLWLVAALDASVVFFVPLVVDIGVVLLASRSHNLFWIYPFVAASGFVFGAAITYTIGKGLGVAGLERFVPPKRLAGFRKRIKGKGAVALALLSFIPPPFPFTACILTAGALRVSMPLFLGTLALTRLLQYGAEAVLAHFYGRQIIGWLQSKTVEQIGAALFAATIIGTAISVIRLLIKTRKTSKRRRAA
jgi:membrane protein YqaA with SNARE-associated domain